MKKTGLLSATIGSLLVSICLAVETPPFITGFETTDAPAYAEGDLDGQGTAGSWVVSAGSANVQTTVVSRGQQAVEMGADSSAEVSVTASNNVIWTDVFFQTTGSTHPPTIPALKASAVLFFGTNDIYALDGDGAGAGTYVSITNPLPTGQFVRVSIRKDFAAKTYDVWLDETPATNGLGFKDNDRETVAGVQICSEAPSFMDELSVTFQGLDVDTDTDTLTDLDELKFHGSDPTLPDTDGDGMRDDGEVIAGTIPGDPTSYLSLQIYVDNGTNINLNIDTVLGRTYAVEQATNLYTDTWIDVPSMTNITGNGAIQTFPAGSTPTRKYFRVTVCLTP